MKMRDALDRIEGKTTGFMVSFEWYGDGFLRSDHFPDKHSGEKLISSENEAWELCNKFAQAMKGKVCNLYVIDQNFSPVNGYEARKIENR